MLMGSIRRAFFLLTMIIMVTFFVVSCENLQKTEFQKDMIAMEKATESMDWPLAEHLLQRILQNNTDSSERWDLWLSLLEVRQNQETYSTSMIEYLETMLVEFNNTTDYKKNILSKLAQTYTAMHYYERAYTTLEQFLTVPDLSDEEQAVVYRDMAHVNMLLKRYEMANDNLLLCLLLPSLAPESLGLCKYNLANMYYVQDQQKVAMRLAKEVFEMPEISDDLRGQVGFILADCLSEQGKQQEALALFKEIRDFYPNELVIDKHIEYLKNLHKVKTTLKDFAKPSKK